MQFSGLPDSDNVFMTYFDRWYKPEDRRRKGVPTTRPDVIKNPNLIGLSPTDVSPLQTEGQTKVKGMVDGMIDAARGDWPTYLSVSAPIDLHWIDEFDKFHNKSYVKTLMKKSNPSEFGNDFLISVCEFGSVLGEVLRATMPNLHWVYDWPYWESSIFDPETGLVVAVYHWSIKKFSSYGIDDGFRAKVLACSETINRERQQK